MADTQDNPSTPSMAYMKMAPRWMAINDVLGGTETMRMAGERRLPKHQEESETSWERRRDTATLLNITELTLGMLSGKPFHDPVHLTEGAPKEHLMWAENIDRMGNNLDDFARRWFREAIAKGLGHVLVDMPRKDNTRSRTLADDKAENVRPYLTLLEAESVLFMSGSIVNGREVLDQVRIQEIDVRREGWSEVVVQRVRVLVPGHCFIYELRENKRKKDEWILVDQWETDLDYIPLVTFYTNKNGMGVSKPPLLDLAYMNISHYQMDSDLRNIITAASFPMLAMSGVDTAEVSGQGSVMRLGPNQILATRSPEGRFYYVEHQGAAIESAMKYLSHTEELMSSYGVQFLRKKPSGMKATVRVLDSQEVLSELQAMALVFRSSLESALGIMSDWTDISEVPKVEMNVDFGLDDKEDASWMAIENARTRHEISRKALIDEMKRRGWMSDEYNEEADKDQIRTEDQEGFMGITEIDIDPSQPENSGG